MPQSSFAKKPINYDGIQIYQHTHTTTYYDVVSVLIEIRLHASYVSLEQDDAILRRAYKFIQHKSSTWIMS